MKEYIKQEVEILMPQLIEISKVLYKNPELGMEEYESSKLIIDVLKTSGFTITENFHTLKTAFKADYLGAKEGVTIGILCEYDALPDIGHGCGHNLISAMSVGAALLLKKIVDKVGGRIILFGTPDEEFTSTKVQLVDEGAFDEIDVAMMTHPYTFTEIRPKSTCIYPIQFEFHGKSCHASGADDNCVNALDAAVMSYMAINNLKQYLDANIYGNIDNGGTRPNIIPHYASMKYYVRANNKTKTEKIVTKISNCVKLTAESIGATMTSNIYLAPTLNILQNDKFSNVFMENLQFLGYKNISIRSDANISTDAGNVSYAVPTIHPLIGLDDYELKLHTKKFADATISKRGEDAIRLASLAMALTGYDILISEKLLLQIKEEFRQRIKES